jgi:hypothetical protein
MPLPPDHPDMDPNNPTGTVYAQEFCEEFDLDPELWGHINNVALDGYHYGRDKIRPLIKVLNDRAKEHRDKYSEHEYADGLAAAARALKRILNDHKKAEEALV